MITVTHKFVSPKTEQTDPTLVGPNEWNATHQVTGVTQFTVSSDYIYGPITPGGVLNPGSNTITLNPMPPCLAVGSSIYISGGVGTPEAAPITGLTSTQVIVTVANSHTGAWTVQSATSGIQEAIVCLNGPGCVHVPHGNWNIYTTILLPQGISIEGDGEGATKLIYIPTNSALFRCVNDLVSIRKMWLLQQGIVATAGSAGIYAAGNGSGVSGANCNFAIFEDLIVDGFYNGFYLAGDGGSTDILKTRVQFCQQDGIVALSAQGYWYAIISQCNKGNGVTNGMATPGGGWTPFIVELQTFGNGGWGFFSTNETQISDSFFNGDYIGEIHIDVLAGQLGYITDSWIQYGGQGPAFITTNGEHVNFGTNNNSPGLILTAQSTAFTIANVLFYGITGAGITTAANETIINNCRMSAMSTYGIVATGGYSFFVNNLIKAPCKISGNANTIANNLLNNNTSVPLLYIPSGVDVVLTDNTIQQGGSGPSLQVDSGVTLFDGANTLYGPAAVNNAALSANSKRNFNIVIKTYGSANPIVGVATATWTSIPWDSATVGSNTQMFLPGSGRIFILASGTYTIIGQAILTPSTAGASRFARIWKNGSVLLASGAGILSATTAAQCTVATVATLASGDYIELQAYQDSGGALNVIGGSEAQTYFSITRTLG